MINNVEELNGHLQNGYMINQIAYHESKSIQINIILAKAENKINYMTTVITDKLISFLNSKILGAKIWKGGFSNIEIGVSGYKFTELVSATFIWKLEPHNQTAAFNFIIDCNIENNKKLVFIDFRERIEVLVNGELRFGGLITSVKPHRSFKNSYIIECEDYSCIFDTEYVIANVGYNKGYLMDTAIFFLDLSSSGVYYTADSIKGIHLKNRKFEIIMPLKGLEITRNFQIGDCLITPKLPEINKIKGNKGFSSHKTFARLNLSRSKFSEAYIDGINLIEGVISFLNYKLKLPIFKEYYELKNNTILVEIGKFISIQDLDNGTIMVMPIPFKKPPLFEITSRNNNLFEPMVNLGQYYIDAERKLSKEEKQELWIFHYLNRAETNINQAAAFLDCWIAFDFIISRYAPDSKLFSDSVFSEIQEFCDGYINFKNQELESLSTIEELTPEDILNKKEEVKSGSKRLKDIVNNFFNNPSIKIRLKKLLEKYDIKLSKQEWSIYNKARETRNSIIHGKEIHVNKDEHKIISKIIYAVLDKTFMVDVLNKNYSKNYNCYECQKKFNSKTNPRGLLNRQGTLIGYYCEDCKKEINQTFLDLFHQKNLCFKCKKPLGNIQANYRNYYENKELHLSYKYKCPHCNHEGETTYLITFDMKEPFKVLNQE